MNKLFTKIATLALGSTMAIGVGVAVGSNTDSRSARAAQGDELAICQGTGSGYGTRRTLTDSHSVGWVLSTGQSGYLGTNNSTNHGKVMPTAADLPVVKAVNSSATTSTTGYYFYYTSTAVSNVGALEFSQTASSAQRGTGYVVRCDTAASSGSKTWTQVTMSSGSSDDNGANVYDKSATNNAKTSTFTFNQTETGSYYYGFIIQTSSNTRYTAGTIKLLEGATSTPSITVDSTATVKKDGTKALTVTYSNMASGLTISAVSDDTSVATVTASQTTTGASGNASFTVTGVAEGTADITFSVTYSGNTYSKTCTVTVNEERSFEKIDSIADLNKTRVGGGRYVIASASSSTTVMSTTQNSNNRGQTTATFDDDVMLVPSSTTIAVVNIEKATDNYADYYTIYDETNSGYLYAVGTNNYLRTSNPATKTDYYYWSISFSSNHAVITNKGNSFVIRHNSSNSIFSCYNGTQNAIDLYELDSDIPAYVALTSISASNDSVQVGSTITFTGSYLPTNATEGIVVKTLSSTYATAGDVSMSAGTFTVSITGVAATAGTTLAFEGEDGHGSASVTLAVVSYTASHDLVTEVADLSNGSRVIIGCTAEGFNYIAEHSTGGTNLSGVTTGFASDKSTLASTSEHEFVVWCVDSTNGYYVFSDGGYYLASPTAKNNYLQRVDVLSERCYFTIEDSENGVVVKNPYGMNHSWTDVAAAYTLEFNSSTSKFSLYASSQKAASLYLSRDSLDPIQGFIDVFLHMSSYTSNNGYCADENHHYYSDAKEAFTSQLTAAQRQSFCTQSAYSAAYARLSSWASNNGDQINASYTIVPKSNVVLTTVGAVDGNGASIIVVVTSLIGLTTVGGFFFLRKKKED